MLKDLESKSIYIVREAKAKFKNPAILWSAGKDSTSLLWMIRKAFFGEVPFPVIHIDTSYKFPEIYKFRDKIAKEWNLNLIIAKNEEALKQGISPKITSRFECCNLLKTQALRQCIEKHGFDAILVSIRHDEHGIRARERFFSPRDKDFRWKVTREKLPEENGDATVVSLQPTELAGWDIYFTDYPEAHHLRVHPILHWTEKAIWKYIKQEGIPVNPLYFAKKRDGKWCRFRSLGCKFCTVPILSRAKTIDKIVEEIEKSKMLGEERAGRAQDKEEEYIMQRLRAFGYM